MLGDNIKRIRKSKGLTQSQLSEKLKVAEVTIRKWEKGEREPNLETIRKIANALDVPLVELIGKENSKIILEEMGQLSESIGNRMQNMLSVISSLRSNVLDITGLTEEESNNAFATGLLKKLLEVLDIENPLSFDELEKLTTSDDFKSVIQYLLFKYKDSDN